MSYPTRSCTVIEFYVIQQEYRNNMILVDVDAGSRVKIFDTKVVTKKTESSLCLGKVNHYFDEVSISVVEFIDKHRNENDH